MTTFLDHLVEAVATAVGIALLGFVVTRVRARRAARAARRDVGRTGGATPGEWFVWTAHGPLLGLRPARLRLAPGSVAWTDARRVQPRWEVPAERVVLEVRRPTAVRDDTRLALRGPEGRRRVRVTGTAVRPLGSLDARYERQLELDVAQFVDDARAAGVVVEDGGTPPRP